MRRKMPQPVIVEFDSGVRLAHKVIDVGASNVVVTPVLFEGFKVAWASR
jgi:hypothetical protein